jgi:uncharacterized alkaline shock family protein YloU
VNALNRVLVIILDALMIIGIVLILLVVLGIAQPDQLAPSLGLPALLRPFADLSGQALTWTLAILIGLLVLGLILLSFEVRVPPAVPPLMIKQDGLGRVTVSLSAVNEIMDRAASQVSGVMGVRSQVEESRKGLRVRSQITVNPTVNVAQVTSEVQEAIKVAAEQQLGRPAEEVDVRAQLEQVTPTGAARRTRA